VTLASLAIQLLNGLASASALFLVSAGLTLIFGVTRVVNFAHGSLYMLGAYIAYSAGAFLTHSFGRGPLAFWTAVVVAALAVAVIGALIEALLLKRLYDAPELLQLTATFGVVLIVRDVALAVWGPEDLLGPRAPGLDSAVTLLGRAVPEYDLFLIVVGPVVLALLTWLVTRTRFGVVVRAASENRALTAALGIDQARLYTAVFALGAFLAGLAGALQLPREPANLNMDLAIIADAFVVTVVGGLGSIPGAFLAALIIALTKALCIALGTVDVFGTAIAFPKLTLVAEFVVMAVVLAVRPHGLLGTPAAAPVTTPLPEQRALVTAPGPREAWVAVLAIAVLVLLPLMRDDYASVLATDILIATLFAASLQFLTGTGGMTSFGHAAYFGVGAYAAALADKAGLPFAFALVLAPVAAWAAALGWLVLRATCRRLSRDADARVRADTWSIAFQWTQTGGSNGIVGVAAEGSRPQDVSRDCVRHDRRGAARVYALVRSPFGRARAVRDSPLRAAAITSTRATQWRGFVHAGSFAPRHGLFAFRGASRPSRWRSPLSACAVMVLPGGLNALFGPVPGAAAFTGLQDTPRVRRVLAGDGGRGIPALVPFRTGSAALSRVLRHEQ
jgi:branched-chain amino acid transport system permease protein